MRDCWNLYLLDADGAVDRVLVEDAKQVGPTAWSPDGRRLALAIRPAGEPYGLYLVDVEAGDVHLVLEHDHLGGVTWASPRQLVAAVGVFSHAEEDEGDVGLYRIRLPDLDALNR
jgi:Tol biopolymer transport system component